MVSQNAAGQRPGPSHFFPCPTLFKIQHLGKEKWIDLTWLSVPLRSQKMVQGQFTKGKVQLQRDDGGIGQEK